MPLGITAIQHYASVMRQWLWLILLGVIVCTGATFTISKLITPVYQTSALIQVNGSGALDANSVFSNQALAQNYSLLISGTDVLKAAAHQLPGVSVSQLRQAVNASPKGGTAIIEVLAQADDPGQAAKIANTVSNAFIQYQEAQSTTQKRSASSPRLTLIQEATPPASPISPHVALNTVIAALMSSLLVLILVLLLDWVDTTIKTSDDIVQLAKLESLGSVPFSKYPNLFTGSPTTSNETDEGVEQAFVIIDTAFDVLSKGQRVIQVTGLRAGAGTSTTAANLAISLASSGLCVLLVDGNLRQPSLHEIFHRSNENGLVNKLKDVHTFQEQRLDLIRAWLDQWSTDIPNLYLLPAGPIPTHPATMLRTPEVRQLMQWLLCQSRAGSGRTVSGLVDIIIYDTLPLDKGADALALAAITEGTVLVVEAGKEWAESLGRAQNTLQRLGSPILGVVVNRQQTKHRSYFYVDRSHRNTDFMESIPLDASKRSPSSTKYPTPLLDGLRPLAQVQMQENTLTDTTTSEQIAHFNEGR